MKILGIESSHDDTSIAILEDSKVVFMLTFSQIEIHKKFGGTLPEIASREHTKNFGLLLETLLEKHDLKTIDYIAYTSKPGLIGSLQMGFLFASALKISLKKPLIAIDHLRGHFFSIAINQKLEYPVLGLILSGGHSEIVFAKNPNHWEVVGQTQDDAVGEVYDKVGRLLNLDYPAGKEIDRIANKYKGKNFYSFSKPITENRMDFSFSGYKTQALRLIKNERENLDIKKFCASFQNHICHYIKEKVLEAIEIYNPKCITLSGGVSANSTLRKIFKNLHPRAYVPLQEYTQDNGAMIAKAAEILLSNNPQNTVE